MPVVVNPIRKQESFEEEEEYDDPTPLDAERPAEEPAESCLCCCCLAGFIGALVAAFQ
jgi:hypothetical protein